MTLKNSKKILEISQRALICFENNFPRFSNINVFPKNYCEESSLILNRLLNNEGITDFKLMKGTNDKNQHHYWLENQKYVIDLTAHQFEETAHPFILVLKNEYSLRIVFHQNIHEITKFPYWEFLENLYSKIKDTFYNEYK
ncbi:hypothetical protein ACFQ4S_07015 [Acinetobacter terrae]|nr:hypothetical protein [Acinetobacter terrae]